MEFLYYSGNRNAISRLGNRLMSNAEVTRIIDPTTAFGRVAVSEDTPIIQISSIYGIPDTVETFEALSGTTGVDEKGFFCSTGTTLASFAVLRSEKNIIYRAGQGAINEISAIFDTPVAGSIQRAGLFSVTDAAQFSFEGTDFGVFYQHSGAVEIQTLTFTTGASGGENATITIDGTGYTVPLTSGTTQHNAFEATVSLSSQVIGWTFTQNDADVISIAQIDENKVGAFSFSAATAVASWTETRAGATSTKVHITEDNWSSPPDFSLDPTLRNVYRIEYQYLGYGDIKYSVLVPGESRFQEVHTIQNANTVGNLNFSNPSMNTGWVASSTSSTSDVTIHGGSSGIFVQGKNRILTNTRSEDNEKSIGTTETNIITIRNRQVFGDVQSKAELVPLWLSVGHENNKILTISIVKNAILGGETNYQYVDETHSIAEFDTAGTTITNGEMLGSFKVSANGDKDIDLLSLVNISLAPTETITITGQYQSGAGAVVGASITWLQNT